MRFRRTPNSAPLPLPAAGEVVTPDSWNFEPGAEVAPGRSVLRHIGGGSEYEVYLAWDERLYSLVVVKLLRPTALDDHRSRRHLQREAAVLARIAHPVLVRSFGDDLRGDYPHLVLEYLDGPTLRTLIRRHGPLPLEQALPLVLGVTAVLHYLAAEGIVHLDVKPGNIVMGMPPRLLDLSLARTVASAARLTYPVGTDPYMPPEQCDPQSWPGRIGPAADVWALGATLYEAVAGDRAYPDGDENARDPAARFPQLVLDPEPVPRDVPAPLASLVQAMLARDPADRPAAADVASALEPLVENISSGWV